MFSPNRAVKLVGVIGIVGMFGLAGAASATDIVSGSHNLTAEYGEGNTTEICIFCHTPHNANVDNPAPLWNRANNTTSYTDHDGEVLVGPSLNCLGCHDGAIAIDAFGGSAGTAGNVIPDEYQIDDLAAQHPVGQNAHLDGTKSYYNAPTSSRGFSNGVRLFSVGGDSTTGYTDGYVECSSCHNPHESSEDLLRLDNDGSALCLTCHVK